LEPIKKILQSSNMKDIQKAFEIFDAIMVKYRTVPKDLENVTNLKYIIKESGALWLRSLGLVTERSKSPEAQANAEEMKSLIGTLTNLVGMFISFNSIDIPAFFEIKMATWIENFLSILKLGGGEQPSGGVTSWSNSDMVYTLKYEVVRAFTFYNDHYETEYKAYIQPILGCVYGLLQGNATASFPYNELLMQCLKYLNSVVGQPWNRCLIENDLTSIILKIIVPNISLQEVDVDLLQTDEQDFVELVLNANKDSRRKIVYSLIQTIVKDEQLSKKFSMEISQCAEAMMNSYNENPAQNWIKKDNAIALLLAVLNKGETQSSGCTIVNEHIFKDDGTGHYPDLGKVVTAYIAPELKRQNVSVGPEVVLAIDAMQFCTIMRGKIPQNMILDIIKLLVPHLSNPNFIIHTCAAHTIGKFVTLQDQKTYKQVVPSNVIDDMFDGLVTKLFACFEHPESSLNDHVLKSICAVFTTSDKMIIKQAERILQTIIKIAERISANPSKPVFNHWLFESLGVFIRECVKKKPESVDVFENGLLPVLFGMLKKDTCRTEFFPYVFQIVDQMVRVRGKVTKGYDNIIGDILSPEMWNTEGAKHALTNIIQTYIELDVDIFVRSNRVNAVLGVFQKLMGFEDGHSFAFRLITALCYHLPLDAWKAQISPVLKIIFTVLSKNKSTPLMEGLILFSCCFAIKYSIKNLIEIMSSIQNNIFLMVFNNIWITHARMIESDRDRKLCVRGLLMIVESEDMLNSAQYQDVWFKALQCALEMIEKPATSRPMQESHDYDVNFNRLASCGRKERDYLPQVTDLRAMVAASLKSPLMNEKAKMLCGKLPKKLQEKLTNYFNK